MEVECRPEEGPVLPAGRLEKIPRPSEFQRLEEWVGFGYRTAMLVLDAQRCKERGSSLPLFLHLRNRNRAIFPLNPVGNSK